MEIKDFANIDFFTILESELHNRGKVRFRVKGISMQPMIRNDHDEVLLSELGNRKPEIGDICLFKFYGRHVLHRFKRMEGDVLYFQGDNVMVTEEHCKINDVVGIVTKVYRDGKEVSPTSSKWHYLTKIHRSKYKFRLLLSRTWLYRIARRIKRMLFN